MTGLFSSYLKNEKLTGSNNLIQNITSAKLQLMMQYKFGIILSNCFAKSWVHDFKLFQKSLRYGYLDLQLLLLTKFI